MSVEVGERPPDSAIAKYPQPDYEKELKNAKENAVSVAFNADSLPPYLRDLKKASFSTILPITLQVTYVS